MKTMIENSNVGVQQQQIGKGAQAVEEVLWRIDEWRKRERE